MINPRPRRFLAGVPELRRRGPLPRPALAIEGGPPVRERFLPFGQPCIGDEEIAEVTAVLRSGWIGTGPRAQQFEQEFAAYVSTPHALALSSCTAGLFLCLRALGVGPGDEVITTPLTFAATANVVEHVGARPVLADIDPRTLNIDPEQAARLVGPRTRALIAVHFGGLPCPMAELRALCDRHGLALIEDAAHAVGARYAGRMAGALGHAAAFSFYGNKNLTTAEGGMLTTADPALAEQVALLRMHGLSRGAWQRFTARRLVSYTVEAPGYKCNMPDLAAALGIHQLRKQEAFLAARERIARRYDAALAGMPLRLQARPTPGGQDRHALHLYAVRLEPGAWRVGRDRVVAALIAEGIGAAIHYRPIHEQPYYHRRYGYSPAQLPHAHAAGASIFSLPISPAMGDDDTADVLSALHKVTARYSRA